MNTKKDIEKIYDIIKEKIITMEYKPGVALPEQATAEQFKISRTPIREVFRTLNNDGFVEIIPNKGAFVKEISQKYIEDMYSIREVLEGVCARRAAILSTKSDLEKLENFLEEEKELYSSGDIEQASLKGGLFHEMIVNLCDNKIIQQNMANIKGHTRRLHLLATFVPGRLDNSLKQHRLILATIKCHDGDLAELSMRRHVHGTMEDVLNNICL